MLGTRVSATAGDCLATDRMGYPTRIGQAKSRLGCNTGSQLNLGRLQSSVIYADHTSVTASGRRNEDGAAVVEFALLLPVLASLLLGTFTGGMAFNQKLALTSGVREGTRYGATLPVSSASCTGGSGTLACWLTRVAGVAVAASEGELDPTVAGHRLCVAYVYPSGTLTNDRTTKLVRTSSGDAVSTGGTCFEDGRAGNERRVQVSASRPGKIEYVLGTVRPTISSDSATRFEAT